MDPPRDYAERMDDLIDKIFERGESKTRWIVGGVVLAIAIVCLTVWVLLR